MDTAESASGLDLDGMEVEYKTILADTKSGSYDESEMSHRMAYLLDNMPYLICAARREVELKLEMVAYLALWATRYQEMQMLDGLHPQHFDRLKELGARMDDFKRAEVPATAQARAAVHWGQVAPDEIG